MLSISRLTDTALASAVYASREALPLPCKTCFRLAGCAFSGRVSNPLDHDRRFLVTFPSSFSGLCLTLAQFDCKNTAYGIIMGSSGWQVVHCPGFHQYLLCTGGDLTPWVGSSFPPATPCIGSASWSAPIRVQPNTSVVRAIDRGQWQAPLGSSRANHPIASSLPRCSRPSRTSLRRR